jgi:hypothetical protein
LITEPQVAGRTNGEEHHAATSRLRNDSPTTRATKRSANLEAASVPMRPTGSPAHAHSTDEGGDKDMAKKVAKKPAKKAGKKR